MNDNEPMTVERLDKALDHLALLLDIYPEWEHKIILLYERVERERAALLSATNKASAIRARLKQQSHQTAA